MDQIIMMRFNYKCCNFCGTHIKSNYCFNTFKECALDLVFVLSTSSRQSSSTWFNIVNFVYKLVSRMNIGKDAVQVGVVTYGQTGANQFYLQDYLLRSTILQKHFKAQLNSINNVELFGDWAQRSLLATICLFLKVTVQMFKTLLLF